MIYRNGGPRMRGVSQYPDSAKTPVPQAVPGAPVSIPTQPQAMASTQVPQKREEISVLIILLFLAVLLSVAAFIAVNVLRHFSGNIFNTLENNGISIDSLQSLRSITKIRVGGEVAIGLILAVALLSRGATTVLFSILWGIADIATILVLISFFRNTAKKQKAGALEILAVIVGLFSMVVTVYMPIEIFRHFREAEYWIPGSENRLSLWVMLPTLIWGIYLVIYFIFAILSMLEKHRNTVTNADIGGLS